MTAPDWADIVPRRDHTDETHNEMIERLTFERMEDAIIVLIRTASAAQLQVGCAHQLAHPRRKLFVEARRDPDTGHFAPPIRYRLTGAHA